jgi:WXXGXW repeat (2 copies)
MRFLASTAYSPVLLGTIEHFDLIKGGFLVRIFGSQIGFIAAIVFFVVAGAGHTPANAQVYVSFNPPPLLPTYEQPALTVPNETWMPGYWALGQSGFYWVPGTWVQAPATGLLYTPGYWGQSPTQTGYSWNQGYWAPQVGYYGGVNYGAGYYGTGYVGGGWQGNVYRYNTAVTNVNPVIIRNVYVNRTVIVRNVTRVSYVGPGGLHYRPTPAQLSVERMRHYPLTPAQREHVVEASRDRNLFYSVNRGRPNVVAVARPLSPTNRPADFKPVAAHEPANVSVHTAAKPAAKPEAKPEAKPVVHHAAPAPHAAPKPAPHPAAKPAPHAAPKSAAKTTEKAPEGAPHPEKAPEKP